jgi:hypothetical protein
MLLMGKAPESVNLLDSIPDDEQSKIASRVFKDYERDLRSSEKYREKRASILKLFIGMLPPSENDGAQVHFSIIAKACIRIHARIYDQQFPSNGEFFGVKPTDAFDLDRSIRVAKHLNWQILHQIPEYVPNHKALIMQWLLYGSAFSYTYWSASKNRPCHEVCATEDIVLPYKRKSTDPNLADMPRITRILRMQRHELEAEAATGYFQNVDKLFDKMDKGQAGGNQEDSQKSGSIQEVTDKASGVEKDEESDSDSPRVLLEQHRWLSLPKAKAAPVDSPLEEMAEPAGLMDEGSEPKKDKKEPQRPVIVTIDRDTKIVVSVRLREDEDPQDRARYNLEQDANEAQYAAAMQQWQMDMQAYEMNQTQMPMAGPMDSTGMPMPGAMDSTGPMMPMAQPPPMQPEMPPPPAPPKMVPIHFFTHYVCIPNPEGVYGYGIGFLLEGNNQLADTLASYVVDAAFLNSTATFIYSRQAKLGRGEFRIRPGEGTQTDLNPQDLDKGIKKLDFAPPDPAMGNMIKAQQEDADDVSSAGDILSGEVGGSNETATTTQIRIGQALQAIAIWNKDYGRARTCEGQKLARLNSVYLGDEEYFSVVDPYKRIPPAQPGGDFAPSVEKVVVARRDYLEDVDITITADQRMASQPQRMAEAQAAFNLVNTNPYLAQNPFLMAAVAKKMFRAMDDPELMAALQMQPPPGMMMPGQQQPGAPGQPPQGPPPPNGKAKGNGPPRPENPGPTVPNAGATPANSGLATS